MNAPPANEDDILAFFRSLSAEARREYEALAKRDERYGEDVASEERDRSGAS